MLGTVVQRYAYKIRLSITLEIKVFAFWDQSTSPIVRQILNGIWISPTPRLAKDKIHVKPSGGSVITGEVRFSSLGGRVRLSC
jgi:hypothetical protein